MSNLGGLLNYDFISEARIVDELGKVLASGYAYRGVSETRWITRWLIRDDESYTVTLHLPGMDTEKVRPVRLNQAALVTTNWKGMTLFRTQVWVTPLRTTALSAVSA